VPSAEADNGMADGTRSVPATFHAVNGCAAEAVNRPMVCVSPLLGIAGNWRRLLTSAVSEEQLGPSLPPSRQLASPRAK
jgi:hypothetical protein